MNVRKFRNALSFWKYEIKICIYELLKSGKRILEWYLCHYLATKTEISSTNQPPITFLARFTLYFSIVTLNTIFYLWLLGKNFSFFFFNNIYFFAEFFTSIYVFFFLAENLQQIIKLLHSHENWHITCFALKLAKQYSKYNSYKLKKSIINYYYAIYTCHSF